MKPVTWCRPIALTRRALLVLSVLAIALEAGETAPSPTDGGAATGQEPQATVKDGLAFSVAPAKAQFGAGERLSFRFTLTSLTDKTDLHVYNPLFDHAYSDDQGFTKAATITLRQAESKTNWTVCCVAEITRSSRAGKGMATLRPGEPWSHTFEFEEYLWFKPEGGGHGVKALPPGTYTATVRLHFVALPSTSNLRWWVGDIASEARPFAVVAPAPPEAPSQQGQVPQP